MHGKNRSLFTYDSKSHILILAFPWNFFAVLCPFYFNYARGVNLYKSGALLRFFCTGGNYLVMHAKNESHAKLPAPLVSAESWAERIKLGISPRASLREQFSKLAAPRYPSTDRSGTPIPGTESRWRHRRCWCSKSWADLISALLFLQKMSPRRSRAMPPIALLPRS